MKQKNGIILLFVVLALTWACTPSALLKDKGKKDYTTPVETSVSQVAGTIISDQIANQVDNSLADMLPTDLPLPDSTQLNGLVYMTDSVESLAETLADTLASALPESTAKELADAASVLKDSLLKKPQSNEPDTTAMDSLALAIYKHNKAVDDSLRLDSLNRTRKNGIDSPVDFVAQDSLIYEAGSGMAFLYGNANVKYQNMDLQAERIYMCLDSSLVHATGARDSTNELIGTPIFKMGSDTYESDTMAFNFKTKKGLIQQVYTQQEDGFLVSELSKRGAGGELYLQHGRYTTCDDPHPDFYLALSRAKVRPGKDVVFGPAYLVVCDVPVPLAVPYGFFPFTKSYSSGFIMPTYGDETERGFYLRDGGYYFALSDYMDLKLIGEIYTKGSWGLTGTTNYRKRYRYSGFLYASYQNTINGEKNMPDYTKQTSFKVQWSHRQDAKANPYSSLSASVNFATSSYERNNLTSMYNPQAMTQSTRTSSVSYNTGFSSLGLTLSSTMNLDQNMRDSTITVKFPDLNISFSRFYPFRRKKMVGKERWYEKISMQYTGHFTNSINTKESELLHKSLAKDWSNGMQHSIPISASFTLFDYLNMNPQVNFSDVTYFKKVHQSWDDNAQVVVRDTTTGVFNVYNWNLSLNASTTLYGMYVPSRKLFGDKVQAIRHVFKPQVSFTYAPNFSTSRYGFYDYYQVTNSDGTVTMQEYFPYIGAFMNTPSKSRSGTLSFDFGNNVEMKVKNEDDSTGFKKISLIDELGFRMSYNFATKVKPLSNLDTRIRLKLTKSYTLNLNAQFASYVYEADSVGGPVRESQTMTYWQKGKLGRFQGMSQNLSYTLDNSKVADLFKRLRGEKTDKKKKDKNDKDEDEEYDTGGETNVDRDLEAGKHGAKKDNAGMAETDEDGYMVFSMPWSLSFGYGITMREDTDLKKFNYGSMRYPYKFTQTLNMSGNIRLSDGWNITFSSGYDFENKKMSMTTASLQRDLHCFNMSCSVVLSPYTSYNFSFRCNASTLTDALKYDKRSSYSNAVRWY